MAVEFWGDAPTVGTSTSVAATTGSTIAGKDVELAAAGYIRGNITDTDGYHASSTVTTYVKVGGAWDLFSTTEVDGFDYIIPGLPTGTYRLLFEGDSRYYAAEYYNNASSLQTATDVTVTSGSITGGTNIQLMPAGIITGTVTGPDGKRPSTIDVNAYLQVGAAWQQFRTIKTTSRGQYRIDGLPTGTYRLRFSGDYIYDDGGDYQRGDYVPEYWDDAASLETAQDIAVWGGILYSDIDAELAEAGGPRIRSVSVPTISGTAVAGSTLTATPGTWDPTTGLSFSYEWLVGGLTVATGPSYTPTGHVGSPVLVRVTASKDGYRPRTATSELTADLATGPAPVFQTQPAINGTPRVGVQATATPGTWTSAGGPSHYQWLVDGTVVTSTGLSYIPVAADAGKSLRVSTTAWAPWAVATIATSPSATIAPGTLVAVKKPRVTGRAMKNAALAVTKGLWSPGATTRAIQWYAGGKAIPKATSTRLKLRGKTLQAVLGKKITVKLTVGARGYTSVTSTLGAPGKVKR